jgi:hypothetical protein
MDDRRFDTLAKRVGTQSRRQILRGMLGIGATAVGAAVTADAASAARRGFSGPSISLSAPSQRQCDDSHCGDDGCGGVCACQPGYTCDSGICTFRNEGGMLI